MRIQLLLVLGLLWAPFAIQGGVMLEMLNGMAQVLTGVEPFDTETYVDIIDCMNEFDPDLILAQESLWLGMLEYSTLGESSNDIWTTCETDFSNRYYENYNCSLQEYGNLPIHEPCNYASNIAYYHMMLEICQKDSWNIDEDYVTALVRASSFLAHGSGMFHSSQTVLGNILDGNMTDVLAFTAYQAAVSSLKPLDSNIVHQLSFDQRPFNAIEVSENVQATFINDPLLTWAETINATDIPRLRLTMCGYLGTIMTLVFDDETVDQIAELLINSFDGFSPDVKEFCLVTFLDEVREATSNIVLPEEEISLLTQRLEGVLIKLLYAAVWQEEVFIDNQSLLSPEANEAGAEFLPLVNDFANQLLGFNHSNPNFQHGIAIYPGEEWCNPLIPHAKWHLQCGVGLTDLVFLADDLHRIFSLYA